MGAATTFGLLLAACSGKDESATTPAAAEELPEPAPGKYGKSDTAPLKDGLAEGMYGGPVGFEGAERYQYPLDSEEGRAIWALCRLRQDGKAPETIRVPSEFPPQLEERVTEGAPSPAQVFRDETGIRVEFIKIGFLENINGEAMETQNGSFDIVRASFENSALAVEAGLLRPLEEFVEAHQPSWDDPVFGYAGGAPVVNRLTKVRGETFLIGAGPGTYLWLYRADLVEDPTQQAMFEDRYGRELRFPLTWDEHAEVAEFFHRPSEDPPLYGSIDLKWGGHGVTNWAMWFVSSGNPSAFYFDDDGSANINTEAGIRATEEFRRSLEWYAPTLVGISDPVGQLRLLGTGSGFMGSTEPYVTHLSRNDPELPFIKRLKAAVSPGRVVDGALVRRPAAWEPTNGVNGFADPARQEAAYLFLQWLGGARTNTWAAVLPYYDFEPLHPYALDEPIAAREWGDQPLTILLGEATPRSAPTPPDGYWDILDEELSMVLSDEQTAEQAMRSTEERWNQITEEFGVERQIELFADLRAGSTDVVDEPPSA